ncbi:hypothetical protein [Actinokineospora globicatena]|uniref:PQQ-like domain-containing protein n=1 Tax=Actinokineospora globicatena TaxID=103729 RepID=A0A9W6QRR5_9PSEU|nr:hypothetical protein [Actinokineospora globicatena]GLW94905.1 hypothetical protein Aglo03_57210 [Actinokineospora globicatena]
MGAGFAVAGLVWAGVSMLLDGGVGRQDGTWGGVGVAGVAVAALVVLWGARRSGLVLAIAATGYAGYLVVTDLQSGVAGPSSVVLLVGAVATLAGALTRRLGGWVLAGVAVLVVAAAGFGVQPIPAAVAVDENTVAAGVRQPVAERPKGEPWRWVADAPVVEAVAAGTGLVVGTDGGKVVSVGPGGRRLWHYGRAGTRVTSLVTTPDQALVVATFSGGGPHPRDGELHVLLDAATGAVVREWPGDDHSDLDPQPSTTVLPVAERLEQPDGTLDFRVHGTDLRGGQHLWTWRAPAGCLSPWGVHESGADVVVVSSSCGDSWGVAALGDRDGVQRWQRLFPVAPGKSTHFLVNRTSDGRAVSIDNLAGSREVVRTDDGVTVGAEAVRGRWLWANAGPVVFGEEQSPDGKVLSSNTVDPATGSVTAVTMPPCAGRRTVATTANTVLRLCFTDTTADLAWQDLSSTTGDNTTGDSTSVPGWTALPGTHGSGNYRSPFRAAGVFPAPGFIAVVRRGDPAVLGFPG